MVLDILWCCVAKISTYFDICVTCFDLIELTGNNYAYLVKICNYLCFDATFFSDATIEICSSCVIQHPTDVSNSIQIHTSTQLKASLATVPQHESHSIFEPHANASLTQESQRSPLTEAGQEPSRWPCLSQKQIKTDDYASRPCRARADDLSQL